MVYWTHGVPLTSFFCSRSYGPNLDYMANGDARLFSPDSVHLNLPSKAMVMLVAISPQIICPSGIGFRFVQVGSNISHRILRSDQGPRSRYLPAPIRPPSQTFDRVQDHGEARYPQQQSSRPLATPQQKNMPLPIQHTPATPALVVQNPPPDPAPEEPMVAVNELQGPFSRSILADIRITRVISTLEQRDLKEHTDAYDQYLPSLGPLSQLKTPTQPPATNSAERIINATACVATGSLKDREPPALGSVAESTIRPLLQAKLVNEKYDCWGCDASFASKDKVIAHYAFQHLDVVWSCSGIKASQAFVYSSYHSDLCGYCGKPFLNQPSQNWFERVLHLSNVHRFGNCNLTKSRNLAQFRRHLDNEHSAIQGPWRESFEDKYQKPSEEISINKAIEDYDTGKFLSVSAAASFHHVCCKTVFNRLRGKISRRQTYRHRKLLGFLKRYKIHTVSNHRTSGIWSG
jgi:hypothetical protein